ncbi:MAG: DUF853 family protein [Flavobacteriales bacterium]|nr:DUF853 family protein [Flavobacteriales bacterium]
MFQEEEFRLLIDQAYKFKGESILLGTAMLDGKALYSNQINIPLLTINRHGLIAGATGTGKTKTVQIMAEKLSEQGVPVLLMDIKGDLSGIAKPGAPNPKIEERHDKIGSPWIARGFPAELLTISEQKGVRLRATISEFGPVLLSRILDLNDTQSGIVSIVFKYCDDHALPLLDVKDFRKVLQYVSNEGKELVENHYGLVSKSSVGAIMRKLLEIEEQGADIFFGERSFEVEDLLRTDPNGLGYVNILRLDDIQSKPRLFSTFMLCLLAEIYQTFPEEGDAAKPKLVLFIDEAHLIFKEASGALLEQIETIVKLIRSKGVGIYFCTQNPTDIPEPVLSQLGLKIQHALRAFTAKDRRAIKLTAENYPLTKFYRTDEELTSLGIGEALLSALNEKGIPTPLVRVLLIAPASRMGILSEEEKVKILQNSILQQKYEEDVDRESAYELLSAKLDRAEEETLEPEKQTPRKTTTKRTTRRPEKSTFEKIATHSLTRTLVRELARGILGVLGIKRR